MPSLNEDPDGKAGQPNVLVIWGDDIGVHNISAYNHGIKLATAQKLQKGAIGIVDSIRRAISGTIVGEATRRGYRRPEPFRRP